MDNIQSATENLIEAVRESQEYRTYLRYENILASQPELMHRVDEFRAENYELNNRAEDIDLFEAVDHFESKYRDLRRIPEVNAFLEAELSLCKRIQKVQDDLFEAAYRRYDVSSEEIVWERRKRKTRAIRWL